MCDLSRCCSKVVAEGSEWCNAACQARGEPEDDDEPKCIICMAAAPRFLSGSEAREHAHMYAHAHVHVHVHVHGR